MMEPVGHPTCFTFPSRTLLPPESFNVASINCALLKSWSSPPHPLPRCVSGGVCSHHTKCCANVPPCFQQVSSPKIFPLGFLLVLFACLFSLILSYPSEFPNSDPPSAAVPVSRLKSIFSAATAVWLIIRWRHYWYLTRHCAISFVFHQVTLKLGPQSASFPWGSWSVVHWMNLRPLNN